MGLRSALDLADLDQGLVAGAAAFVEAVLDGVVGFADQAGEVVLLAARVEVADERGLVELLRELGLPLVMPSPTSCLIPKWALAGKGLFGIGTFYGDCDFFHLFESRKPQYEKIFSSVVNDVVSGRKLDFDKYLLIVEELNKQPAPVRKRNWIPKPLRRFLT